MKFFKYLLPLLALMTSSHLLFAQIETDSEDIESEPFEELEELERRVLAEQSKGQIAVTADVRLKWVPQSKKNNGYWTRGSGSVNPVSVPTASQSTVAGAAILAPTNFFQVEANLYLDYAQTKDWVEAQITFKNTAGIESNAANSFAIRKAWIGYSFWKSDCAEFYVELGRKGLSSLFDSRIQFDAPFDGILFVYETATSIGKLKLDGGPCIVDYFVDHYGYVGEAVLKDIACTDLWAKYSLAWWRKENGVDRNGVHDTPQYRFVDSQWLVGYDFDKKWLGQPTTVYGAFEVNHAAIVTPASLGKKRNNAWYVGIEYGKIGSAGDYLFDICYQDVGYQAVPNFDSSGIGRGNSTSRGDLRVISDPWNSGNYTIPSDVLLLPAGQAEGNTNYRGIEIRGWWTITKHLTLKEIADYSVPKYSAIGGQNRFIKFELNLIYDF